MPSVQAALRTFLSIVVLSSGPSWANAACPANVAFAFPDSSLHGPVLEGSSKGLFFKGQLRVNTDGAPNSYHPLGQQAPGLKPINYVCNAIAIELPDKRRLTAKNDRECRFISDYYVPARNAGWTVSPEYRIDWYAIAAKPIEGGRYRPCIQTEGKYAGFFVSQTALATGVSRDICDPAYWANSLTIPYITLPRGSDDFASRGAGNGDLALVGANIDGVTRVVVAVVADVGNARELGEGSVALHRMLRGQAIDPAWAGQARTLHLQGGVWTVLLPNVQATRPITADGLQARRDELLQAVGGEAAIQECFAASSIRR